MWSGSAAREDKVGTAAFVKVCLCGVLMRGQAGVSSLLIHPDAGMSLSFVCWLSLLKKAVNNTDTNMCAWARLGQAARAYLPCAVLKAHMPPPPAAQNSNLAKAWRGAQEGGAAGAVVRCVVCTHQAHHECTPHT